MARLILFTCLLLCSGCQSVQWGDFAKGSSTTNDAKQRGYASQKGASQKGVNSECEHECCEHAHAAAAPKPTPEGHLAIGGAALSIPLPTLHLPRMLRVPAFAHAVLPVATPQQVVHPVAVAHPAVVTQSNLAVHHQLQTQLAQQQNQGLSEEDLKTILQALRASNGTGAATNGGGATTPDADTLDAASRDLDRIQQRMQELRERSGSGLPANNQGASRLPAIPRPLPEQDIDQVQFRRLPSAGRDVGNALFVR